MAATFSSRISTFCASTGTKVLWTEASVELLLADQSPLLSPAAAHVKKGPLLPIKQHFAAQVIV